MARELCHELLVHGNARRAAAAPAVPGNVSRSVQRGGRRGGAPGPCPGRPRQRPGRAALAIATSATANERAASGQYTAPRPAVTTFEPMRVAAFTRTAAKPVPRDCAPRPGYAALHCGRPLWQMHGPRRRVAGQLECKTAAGPFGPTAVTVTPALCRWESSY
jgi:hypothetical protein